MAAPSIKKSYFLIQYSFKPYKHTSDNSYCLTTYLSEPDRYIFAESLTKNERISPKKKSLTRVRMESSQKKRKSLQKKTLTRVKMETLKKERISPKKKSLTRVKMERS